MSSSLTERATFFAIVPYHVYFLRNEVGTPYVGHTGHLPEKRLQEHNEGLNRWTRAHRPWHLVYFETFENKSDAIRRERYFKTGTGRRERDEIIEKRRRFLAQWIESTAAERLRW